MIGRIPSGTGKILPSGDAIGSTSFGKKHFPSSTTFKKKKKKNARLIQSYLPLIMAWSRCFVRCTTVLVIYHYVQLYSSITNTPREKLNP